MGKKSLEPRVRDNYMTCPFYEADDQYRTVRCEGLTEGGKLYLAFKNQSDFIKWLDRYCINDQTHCPIYKLIMEQKYKDD